MRPEDRDLIFALVVVPGREARASRRDILHHFGTVNGRELGLGLLREAVDRRDAVDTEAALVVCNVFGFGIEHLDLLVQLSSAGWHQSTRTS